MTNHRIVDHAKWLDARKALLAREKEFTRLRDDLTRQQRELPWEKIEKTYTFDGPDGKQTLSDLFDRRNQLIVYHFMYGPEWEEGCPSCSLIADHFNPSVVHLKQRDVTMVAISRAPLAALENFKRRMGWSFPWLSAYESDFNQDFNVSFSQEELDRGDAVYNYKKQGFPSREAPGASVFYKDESGQVYHTYSVFQRGLDMFITAYHLLDIVPKGRDEDGMTYTMEWLRLHDAY